MRCDIFAVRKKGRPGRATRPVVLFFVAYPYRMAGANRSLIELVTNLPVHIRPIVLTTAEGPVADAYRQAGIPCSVLTPPRAFTSYGGDLLRRSSVAKAWSLATIVPYTFTLYRLLKRYRVDLVHVNEIRGALLAAPAGRLCQLPVVQHLRGEFSLGRVHRAIFEVTANRIIAVSEGTRATLSPRGKRKTSTVYNGVREAQGSARRIRYIEELRARDVRIVCCFASVVPFKGHHHLVGAVDRLREQGWGERLAVFCVGEFVSGYEDYHRWLLELAAARGIQNVTFTGWQDDPFVFYRYADVSVLPSVSLETIMIGHREVEIKGAEGFPRTHLEAMAHGVPIVGTRIAGVPEQVEDGVTGLLVDPGDEIGLADALSGLLVDTHRAREMGQRGRERALERFSTASHVSRIVDLYENLLSAKGTPGA